jgi:hypothetical protein
MKLLAFSLALLSLSGVPFSQSQSPVQPASQAPTARASIQAVTVLETGGQDEVTKANWQQHPKIKAVRTVVQTVKSGLAEKSFKVRTREFEYCEPYADGRRTLAIDPRGRVRYYEKQAGSDDSALKWEHYYDEAGRLRFVLITGGAANGSELEHRIYFDEEGKRIWEEQKYTKGPGYTFPEVWPEEQLQRKDVSAAFAAKSACPEKIQKPIKGSPKSKVQSPGSRR